MKYIKTSHFDGQTCSSNLSLNLIAQIAKSRSKHARCSILTLIVLLALSFPEVASAQDKFTFEDVMRFETLSQPVLSDNGAWIGYSVWPERGDGEARFQQVRNPENEWVVPRANRPQIAPNAAFAAALVQPPFIESENASASNRPRASLALLNLSSGDTTLIAEVQRFEFTRDARWLIAHQHRPTSLRDAARKNSKIGSPVSIIALPSGDKHTIPFVAEAASDSTGRYFVYAISDTLTENNGLYFLDLSSGGVPEPTPILEGALSWFGNLTWDNTRNRIAFTAATLDSTKAFRDNDAHIVQWQLPARNRPAAPADTLLRPADVPDDFRLRTRNNLTWTRDGSRLFYGLQSAEMVAVDEQEAPKDSVSAENLYDLDFILRGVESDVWHYRDPLIKTNEKQTWNRRKNHLYTGVIHLSDRRAVQLATLELPEITISHNPDVVIGRSNLPHRKLITWDGNYHDYYLVRLNDGSATQIREKARFGGNLSPDGRFYAYYDNEDWYLMETSTGNVRPLTAGLDVPFANEDNDRPMPSPGYGVAGWTTGSASVLIHDKFDIWQFQTSGGSALNLTNGRENDQIFRIRDFEEDRVYYRNREQLLLTMYNDRRKNFGFYRLQIGRQGVTQLLEEDARFNIVAKARNSDEILFTKERYDLYPNLWVAGDERFRRTNQISRLHEDLNERWLWGEAELISWLNVDGREVQGVLIYPGDYQPGKQYPVLVYYYERFSQRLHEFNHPVTNHRPNYAQYTSDGYAVFLPDVWFDVPIPGYSATKNLVPGVHKLIEMGIADPYAIGLHGHSWSGYLTAHVITQTDIFAAAVAGAPVSNMTSAYSGIRWGTGLARQFQYEQTQSRLGVSMYDNHQPYIENSPVFFAHRINTPLLLQFGDEDEAVPWEQGIELYLALRRLGKESVFLQYHGEPHHLRKFANRLDYAIKMKEYFDHYLRGHDAPEWITEGIPYRGE